MVEVNDVKRKLKNKMIEELKIALTLRTRINDNTHLTNQEIENYIEQHDEKINGIVLDLHNSFLNDEEGMSEEDMCNAGEVINDFLYSNMDLDDEFQ